MTNLPILPPPRDEEIDSKINLNPLFADVPVWSKIETGRVPSPPELLQIIDNNLKLMRKVDDLGL